MSDDRSPTVSQNLFPLPTCELALAELMSDMTCNRLSENDKRRFASELFSTGFYAARYIRSFENSGDFRDSLDVVEHFLNRWKVTIQYVRLQQNLSAECRIVMADYRESTNSIRIDSFAVLTYAEHNRISLRKAKAIVLAHEFCHHLEANHVIDPYRGVRIYRVKLGRLNLGRVKPPSFSEAVAHGFADYYLMKS